MSFTIVLVLAVCACAASAEQKLASRRVSVSTGSRVVLGKSRNSDSVHPYINGNKAIHVVNEKSPSVAMETRIFSNGLLKRLSNPKLLTLVKALGPSYVRVGGSHSDHSSFDQDGSSSTLPSSTDRMIDGKERHSIQKKENAVNTYKKYQNIIYTGQQFDELMTFIRSANMDLIFQLNLLDRRNGKWNPENSKKLLKYAKSRSYSMDWELGNEPDTYPAQVGLKLTAGQVAKDLVRLKSILEKDSWWKKSKIIGPDLTNMTPSSRLFFKKYLHHTRKILDASTFHHYYIDSHVATIQNLTDPRTLDGLLTTVRHAVKITRLQSPNLAVWLGETGSSYNGGVKGLTNTVVAGFMWLDKLGLTAANGVDMVIRQNLFDASYALLDKNFDPNPDYWLTLLYKRLVGPKVLKTPTVSLEKRVRNSQHKYVRVYAHCTNTLRSPYKPGSITMYFLNLSDQQKTISSVATKNGQRPTTAAAYILTSSPTALNSSDVYLNNARLRMLDDTTLPALVPRIIDLEHERIKLPQKSFGFIVLPDVNAPACS